MKKPSNGRRDFLRTSFGLGIAAGLAGGPFGALAAASPRRSRVGANERLAIAKIAVGGMGNADLGQVASHRDVQIVGLCDVDANILAACGKTDDGGNRFADAKRFADYREMLETLGDRIDAVVVSTPDHTHAIASLDAMARGKHVYTQKPLARAAHENRLLADAARARPALVTQMGTQRSATRERRLAYELVREGVVGPIRAIHSWTDRPAGWWPSGGVRGDGSDPVPEHLAWDLWLGPAPTRPYRNGRYAHFNWRGTRDFGTGAFGDMACHILDMPFYALDLGLPTGVRCEAKDGSDDQFPSAETVRMRFAPTSRTAAEGLELVWFDGGRLPDFGALGLPPSVAPGDRKEPDGNGFLPLPRDGAAILVGEGGLLVIPIDGQAAYAVLDGKVKSFADRLGEFRSTNHWHDWVDACLGRGTTRAPFQRAALLCEALSVGAVASEFLDADLAYDAKAFTFAGSGGPIERSTTLLRPAQRSGWSLPVVSA